MIVVNLVISESSHTMTITDYSCYEGPSSKVINITFRMLLIGTQIIAKKLK